MKTYDVKLIGKKEVADKTMEFTLEKPPGFTYRAGQYGDIVLPKKEGVAEQEYKHGFSFLSAPFEEHLRMATRMRDTPFKRAIKETPEGSQVQLIATFGDFTLHKNESIPAVFVIGGIGITPVLGIIAQATHDKTSHKLTLIYANKTPESAAYTGDLAQLALQNPNFTFVPVYTEKQGNINADRIKRSDPDLTTPKYYLSGPEGMVTAMRSLLIEVGADEDNIRTEEFEGY